MATFRMTEFIGQIIPHLSHLLIFPNWVYENTISIM
jgi:hypothetical protein